jgi:hypothetical protein
LTIRSHISSFENVRRHTGRFRPAGLSVVMESGEADD